MTERALPKKILLATDLSHRCDRAFDRGVQLAQQWGAELIIVHAVEPEVQSVYDPPDHADLSGWSRPVDPVRAARKRVQQDLAPECRHIDMDVRVERGSPTAVVLDIAAQEQVDLIVTGVARGAALSRLLLGETVAHLAQKSPVPLLVVRDRSRGPYGHVIVATDFEPPARHAFETAARFFPEAAFSLFHGYDIPFVMYLGRQEVEQLFEELGRDAVDKFLEEADVPPAVSAGIGRLVQHGAPEALLRDFGQQSAHHLTVVGSHQGNVIYEALIGSAARRIIDAVPGDVLLVPATSRHEES